MRPGQNLLVLIKKKRVGNSLAQFTLIDRQQCITILQVSAHVEIEIIGTYSNFDYINPCTCVALVITGLCNELRPSTKSNAQKNDQCAFWNYYYFTVTSSN